MPFPAGSDADLLKALRSGDSDAFQALVADYRDRIVSTCFRFLGNREDAEETALDVFLEIHRGLPAFREEARLSTWIYRIAVTRSLDVLRKRKRKKRFTGSRESRIDPAAMNDLPAPADADPGRALEIRERSRILRAAVAKLAENQRVAITLSRYEGLGNKAIAEVLGTSVPAVDALLHRAHRNLRRILEGHYSKAVPNEGEE